VFDEKNMPCQKGIHLVRFGLPKKNMSLIEGIFI
jgi:hypothetical protein